MLNLYPNRKVKNLKFLPGSSVIQESYQEVQESRILTGKSKNPGFPPGILGIQISWQENQDFPGSQMMGGLANHLEKCLKPVTRNQNPFKVAVLVRSKLHLISFSEV